MDLLVIPISALQRWLFCNRQCCLVHIDQEWEENVLTVEGNVLHSRVDEISTENRGDKRILRALPISSQSLGLTGKADVVEFQGDIPFPVEYKRGKPKKHRADEAQLCAQAICLEEMFGCEISKGALYYDTPKRRTEVIFDSELRNLVTDTTLKIRNAIEVGTLPLPVYEKGKCNKCSLIDVCKPRIVSKNINVEYWIKEQIGIS